MRNLLVNRRRRCVYHFTDRTNINSIIACGGLLSSDGLDNGNVENVCFGGNDWSRDADRRSGLTSYIHLCFKPRHPMQYLAAQDGRIADTCWLEISLDVLDGEGVRYTVGVANRAGEPLLLPEQAREQIDLCGLFDFLDFDIAGNQQRKLDAEKSQILVPNFIPIAMMANINSFVR